MQQSCGFHHVTSNCYAAGFLLMLDAVSIPINNTGHFATRVVIDAYRHALATQLEMIGVLRLGNFGVKG